jgi:hypothetical protein
LPFGCHSDPELAEGEESPHLPLPLLVLLLSFRSEAKESAVVFAVVVAPQAPTSIGVPAKRGEGSLKIRALH